ncbi:MAG TPA: tetratricopeptide repeat protein [Azospirillaceae bacterium]|nr:tetratricopeptide repeat protein [Azospirillaceae bacterium]
MAKDNRPTLAALALAAALAFPAPAATAGGQDLAACLKAAETVPDTGLEKARDWENRGGGDRAKLCHAMALFHGGQFAPAGERLEALVETLGRDDAQGAATLLSRAGWAWLRAGQAARAERAYTQALARLPEDEDILIDRAIARAGQEKYWDAVADLTTVLNKAPQRAEAWLYRASAYRHLGNLELALGDVGRALALKPNDPEALLLRGNLQAQDGDAMAARADWRQVIKLAPTAPEARSAEANLKRLDAAGKR